ncbi:KRAB-A domain-containing protein 2-like [Penaeus japonicus]|uniref:KRAB-A domain-containing protein 2-like n=1 Tax=Penaeus japonicus TaxID=27405 RepID=UPI001C70BB78|nr:KRAB-A domain-containing protein 2-like [Penaeus japonicus]
MDAATRYPEAIPLRSIMSKTIVPALLKFFTQFGLPEIVQSDQGSNFTSKMFKEVMSTLGIKQHLASSYHPQSQGALERSHQTIKSMLTDWLENCKDWDEGIPLVLYALRSSKQESLGCSPNELLFGKEVRGPLKLLFDSWVDMENDVELTEYVSKLKDRLKQFKSLQVENLAMSPE